MYRYTDRGEKFRTALRDSMSLHVLGGTPLEDIVWALLEAQQEAVHLSSIAAVRRATGKAERE